MGQTGTQANPLLPPGTLDNDKSLIGSNTTKPLLVYLTRASLLATTHEEYRYAIKVKEDEYEELKAMPDLKLDELLHAQKEIKDHCTTFKDATYPKIIELASKVRHYAAKVGGKPSTSYYGALVTQMTVLEDAQLNGNTDLVKSTKNHIMKLADVAIKEANGIVEASESAVKDLQDFEQQCTDDKKTIGSRQQDIETALNGIGDEKGGKIKTLKDEIEVQGALWWKNYREFVIATTAAATSVLWLAIPVFGLIIMPVAAGVGSAEARKLHDAMDDCNRIIEKDAAQLAQYMKLSFDIGIVQKQTDELHKLIGPAIEVITENKGIWKAIASDVTKIRDEIMTKDKLDPDNKDNMLDSLLAGMNVEFLISEWNKVADKADNFRLHAYSTGEIQQADMSELKKQLNSIETGHGAER